MKEDSKKQETSMTDAAVTAHDARARYVIAIIRRVNFRCNIPARNRVVARLPRAYSTDPSAIIIRRVSILARLRTGYRARRRKNTTNIPLARRQAERVMSATRDPRLTFISAVVRTLRVAGPVVVVVLAFMAVDVPLLPRGRVEKKRRLGRKRERENTSVGSTDRLVSLNCKLVTGIASSCTHSSGSYARVIARSCA